MIVRNPAWIVVAAFLTSAQVTGVVNVIGVVGKTIAGVGQIVSGVGTIAKLKPVKPIPPSKK